MTIKRKLFVLVFGELLMFLLIIGVILFSLFPILKINREFNELSTLAEKVLQMELSTNGLIFEPLELQYENVLEAKEDLEKNFAIVSKQKSLSGINRKVALSMDSILALEKIFEKRWTELTRMAPVILEYSQKYMYTTTSPLISFYKADWLRRNENAAEILEEVGDFEQQIRVTDGALSSAHDVISTNYEIINFEISKQINSMIIRTAIIFVFMIAVIILFSIKTASGMAGGILALEKGVSLLREGRLQADFKTITKDEVASLGENLNSFTLALSDSILKIKETSLKTLGMKNELLAAAESSQSSAGEISSSVHSIREGMVDLDTKVAESGEAVNTVKSRAEELGGMLDEQMAMIEESTSAVTEMIASINNVSDITGKKKTATDELVKTAENGGARLDNTIRIIQEITGNVDEIRGTASIIQSVAAQTSLLAMNAAIEAAHAGEYGAGFSVVAEEIRKLADASGTSSKRISGVIKDVVGSIEQAALSGDDTRRAFSEINSEVVDVADALDEISSSMDELSAGGRQILDAMTSLQGYAVNVRDGGNAMSGASVSLEDAFRIVERVTSTVLSQIGGIGKRIEEISGSVEVVADISSRLSGESELLATEVSGYSVVGAEAPDVELLSASVVDETSD